MAKTYQVVEAVRLRKENLILTGLKIFENEEFGEIRSIVIEGEPWFVGKDVASALGYADPSGTVRKKTDEEDRGVAKMDTPSGIQEMVVINESGLYALILGSKLESAKKFKHWVTSDVLPSIRKTGKYDMKKDYETKSTSLGEVASFTKEMGKRMEKQGSAPWKICEAFKMVSEQFGIRLPDDFVKVPEYEQMSLQIFDK